MDKCSRENPLARPYCIERNRLKRHPEISPMRIKSNRQPRLESDTILFYTQIHKLKPILKLLNAKIEEQLDRRAVEMSQGDIASQSIIPWYQVIGQPDGGLPLYAMSDITKIQPFCCHVQPKTWYNVEHRTKCLRTQKYITCSLCQKSVHVRIVRNHPGKWYNIYAPYWFGPAFLTQNEMLEAGQRLNLQGICHQLYNLGARL